MTTHETYRALGGTRTELNRGLSKALYAISAVAIWLSFWGRAAEAEILREGRR